MSLVRIDCLTEMDHNVTRTERQQIRIPNLGGVVTRMRGKFIVDWWILYQPLKLQAEGWSYYFEGRTAINRN